MKPQNKLILIVNIIDSCSHKIVILCLLSIGFLAPDTVHANESCLYLLSDMNITRSTDPRLIFYGKCAGGLPSLDKTVRLISDVVIAKTGLKMTYDIVALPFPWNTTSPTITYSSDLTSQSFAPQPGERKILTYMMFSKSDDSWLGTHAVSLLNYSSVDGIAKVSDPNMPTIELNFKMQKDVLDDDEGTTFEMIPLSPEFFKMYPDSKVKVHSIVNIKVVVK